MKALIIIPSRFASQRLPQKPLALIKGKTLVERVYRQCAKAEGIDDIYIATDHPQIRDVVKRFGGKVIMTSPDCASGTDRVAEAMSQLGTNDHGNEDAIYINVQGDEPLIEPDVISALVEAMRQDPAIQVATPISKLTREEDLTNPNVVKVVRATTGDALYFSRQTIPYVRDLGDEEMRSWLQAFPYFKHIGVYAYRPKALQAFVSLPESPLEKAERLEQLRLLQAGIRIRCVEVVYDSVAVDTQEDIHTVELLLEERGLA